MQLTDSSEIPCPYCGELLTIAIDPTVQQAEYVEDCHVCCRPILIEISGDPEFGFSVIARPENE